MEKIDSSDLIKEEKDKLFNEVMSKHTLDFGILNIANFEFHVPTL